MSLLDKMVEKEVGRAGGMVKVNCTVPLKLLNLVLVIYFFWSISFVHFFFGGWVFSWLAWWSYVIHPLTSIQTWSESVNKGCGITPESGSVHSQCVKKGSGTIPESGSVSNFRHLLILLITHTHSLSLSYFFIFYGDTCLFLDGSIHSTFYILLYVFGHRPPGGINYTFSNQWMPNGLFVKLLLWKQTIILKHLRMIKFFTATAVGKFACDHVLLFSSICCFHWLLTCILIIKWQTC